MNIKLVKILTAVAGMGVAFGAAANAPIEVQTVAQKEERYVDADGQSATRLVPVAAVVPGDQVIYTVTFTNKGAEPASSITVTDPIPSQMRYVPGSAFGPGTNIVFSADGGETFSAPDGLYVNDGNGGQRLARAEEFTHVRWHFQQELAPGARGYARFKAILD